MKAADAWIASLGAQVLTWELIAWLVLHNGQTITDRVQALYAVCPSLPVAYWCLAALLHVHFFGLPKLW